MLIAWEMRVITELQLLLVVIRECVTSKHCEARQEKVNNLDYNKAAKFTKQSSDRVIALSHSSL